MAGGTYFFTVNLADCNPRLLGEHCDVLYEEMRFVKTAHSFHLDAVVILPDHMYDDLRLLLGIHEGEST